MDGLQIPSRIARVIADIATLNFFPASSGFDMGGARDVGSVQEFAVPNLSDRRDIRHLASEHPRPARRHFGLCGKLKAKILGLVA